MAKGRRDGQEAERAFARQLGGRLTVLRDRLGWTQQETSEKIQLSIEAYGRLERGVSIPTADTLDRVCRGMNITPNELRCWAGRNHPPPIWLISAPRRKQSAIPSATSSSDFGISPLRESPSSRQRRNSPQRFEVIGR